MPVEEERRRAGHAARLPDEPVLRDPHACGRAVYVLREALHVETELLRVLDEERARRLCLRPFRLMLVEQIVHLPELPLRARSLGGAGRFGRELVYVVERKIAEGEAHAFAVLREHALRDGVKLSAGRALVIAELLHLHGRVQTTFEVNGLLVRYDDA